MKNDNFIAVSSTILIDISLVHPDKNATEEQLQQYKLLFAYPSSNLKELLLHSGLIEGLIQIGKSFGSTKALETIKTKFFTIVLYEWEKDLFLAMDFKNDSKNIDVTDQFKNNLSFDFKLKKIVTTFASTFKLLHGSPRDIHRQTLEKLLNAFIPAFLSANHPLIDLSRDMNFINTLVLNSKTCLDIELFAAHLLNNFNEIKQLSLVHSGYLIHQGIDLEDFRSIHTWLSLQANTKQSNNDEKRSLTPFDCLYDVKNCGYLIGLNGKNLFLPIICVGKNRYHLSVLKYESLILIMLLDDTLKYDINTKTLLNSIKEAAKTDLGGMKGIYESVLTSFPKNNHLFINYTTKESQGTLGSNDKNALALSLFNLLSNIKRIKYPDDSNSVPISVHNGSLKTGNSIINSKMDVSNRLHIKNQL